MSSRSSFGLLSPQKVYPENTWTIIRAFGYEDVYDELGGPNSNIHRLENVLTLTSTLQSCFDRLEFWFEATVTPSRILFLPTHKWTTSRTLQTRTECVQMFPNSTRRQAFQNMWCSQLNSKTSLYHHRDTWRSMQPVAALHICLAQRIITAIWMTRILL